MNRKFADRFARLVFLFAFALGTAWRPSIPVQAEAISTAGQEEPSLEYNCVDPIGCLTVNPGDPVHIAYALVTSGPSATLGIEERNGVQLAIEHSGGQILGHTVQFDGVDERCTAEGGQAAGTALAADTTIAAVIGTSCSASAREAMPLLSAAGLVMVSPSNTSPVLTEPGGPYSYPGYYRTIWNDKDQALSAAQYARDVLGVATAATIQDGSSYSQALQQEFVTQFQALSGNVSSQITIDPGQNDFSAELGMISADAPALIYFPVFTPAGGHIISQARSTAGLENVALLGADGLWAEDLESYAGADVEGFFVTGSDSTQYTPDYYDTFLPAYLAEFGNEPTTVFAGYAYDAFMMVKAAIEIATDVDPDGTLHIKRQALRDALTATTNFSGLTGSLTCSATGDCADPHLAVYEYHTGQYPPDYVWPEFVPMSLTAPNCDHGGLIQSIVANDPHSVTFNLCRSDAAFLPKLAMQTFAIYPQYWIEATSGPHFRTAQGLQYPVGTGPYMASQWDAGNSITFTGNPDYWGTPPEADTLVFRWNEDPAQRLTALRAAAIDGYDNVVSEDIATIQSDPNLQLVSRMEMNTFYIGMTNTFTPFHDVRVRQAIAMGIDRQQIVDNFYPTGAELATHFTPCSIPNGCTGDEWYAFNPTTAQTLLTQAGYPTGFQTTIYYRDVMRGYLPDPSGVAAEIQSQLLTNLGIDADIVPMESGTFISEALSGNLNGLYLLGWGVDYPHISNFLDYHFGQNNLQFGVPFPEIYDQLNTAMQYADPAAAAPYYAAANNAIRDLIPMVPVAHSTSVLAYRADVANPQASSMLQDLFALSDPGGRATFNWMQGTEPTSVFCADDMDGAAWRACSQIMQGLYMLENNGVDVEPVLAESCTPNGDLTVWTCSLRQNVKFHDGSLFDANDVVATFTMGLDVSSPTHKGLSNAWDYYSSIWGLMSMPSENVHIDVWFRDGHINAYDWPLNSTVTLSVEDPGTPQSPDYSTNTQVGIAPWNPNKAVGQFYINEAFNIQPGMTVTVSGSGATRELVVANLAVTTIDEENDIISGTTEPNRAMLMWYDSTSGHCCRNFQSDGSGNWSLDYSVPGPNGEPIEDLQPGSSGNVNVLDDDRDYTSLSWRILEPFVEASPYSHWIHARDWPLDTWITLELDDPSNGTGVDYTATDQIHQAPWNPGDPNDILAEFNWPNQFAPGPGYILKATGNGTSKTLTISELTVTEIDPANDTLGGVATPGAEVEICINFPDHCANRWTIADSVDGSWIVDYGDPGPQSDWEIVDVNYGFDGWAAEYENDGDRTWVDWMFNLPHFRARLGQNRIEVSNWPAGELLTLEIDDPATTEQSLDYTDTLTPVLVEPLNPFSGTEDAFELGGAYLLKPGDEVTISGGGLTRATIVADLHITSVDIDNDTISGTAGSGVENVSVRLWSSPMEMVREAAVVNGNWVADFSVPTPEFEAYDLGPGDEGVARWSDDDGDMTSDYFRIPRPYLEVRTFPGSRIDAYEWEFGATLTLEINDPATPENPDFTNSVMVDSYADWNPNITYEIFQFGDFYDLKPGDEVTLSDGTSTKQHIVTPLTITDIDPVTDIVSGDAAAGSQVNVWACGDNGCPQREEVADEFSHWSTDFSDPSQEMFNIGPGTWVDSGQWDNDGDGTLYGWNVPNPNFSVRFPENEVHGYEWPLGASVDLTIDDPNTPQPIDYTDTQPVIIAPWDPNQSFVQFVLPEDDFRLEPGMIVTMSDLETSKSHVVSDLTVTNVDAVADTISGTAEPGALVEIGHIYCDEFGCYGFRRVYADVNGNWIVDFSVPGEDNDEQDIFDILPGTASEARQPDNDWDSTTVQWYAGWIAPPSVPMVVALTQDVSLSSFTTTLETWTVLNVLMETLYRNDSDGNLVPAAATNYSISPDGRVYTVTLRPDTFWSDGVPVTAQHFVDGILYLLDADNGYDYPDMLFPIAGAQDYYEGTINDPNLVGVRALNSTTLEITLAAAASHFTQLLAFPTLLPVRLDLIALYGDQWAEGTNFVGNGPYKIDEHDGAHLLLSQNEHYYNRGRLAYSQIGFSIIPHTRYQVESYERGEVDVVLNLNFDTGLAEQQILPRPGIQFLGFNVALAPTDDPLVRKALLSAINKEELVDAIGRPWFFGTTAMVPPEIPGSQYGEIGYDYSATQAQTYLSAAGYPGGTGFPGIQLVANTNLAYFLEEIAAQWRSVLNIDVNIIYYSVEEYGAVRAACIDDPANCPGNLLSLSWLTDYPDPYNILKDLPSYAFLAPGWENASYDALLGQSEMELDPAQRLLDLQAAERILVEDDAAVVPLFHWQSLNLIRPDIHPAPIPLFVQYLDLWGPCFTLTTNVSPLGGGTVNADPAPNCNGGTQYTYGTLVELTAAPNASFTFGAWSGDVSGSLNPVSVTMDGNKAATATFNGQVPGPFTKTSPANGFSGPATTRTLIWSTSAGRMSYEYCLDTTNDNACSTSWISTGGTRSVTVSGLNPNATYYWQVRALNSYGTTYADGTETNYWTFLVSNPPGAFTKTTPANGTTGSATTRTLIWNASTYRVSYEYCLDTTNDNACTTSWVSTGGTRSVTVSGLQNGTTYYWQVRAINSAGTTYADGTPKAYWSFTTAGPPGGFNKLTPINGTTNSATNRTLIWSASSGRTSYEYCIDTTNDNACSTEWVSTGGNRSVALTDLAMGTTYYWQVRAINSYGTTYAQDSETSYWKFTTVSPPGAFTKTTPANGTLNSPTTRSLIWSASTNRTSYEYCLDTVDDGVCNTNWVSTAGNRNITISGLNPATTYYWQVRAINSYGTTYANGDETNYWRFTTAP
jgi:ABC-type oligopeptide transport system substrate-binding subunit/ABC-type branched-subunit amino acid transport system substrate-binding protein